MKQTEHQKIYEKRRRMLHRDERIYAQYKSKSKTFLLKWAKEEDLRAALQMIEIRLKVLKNRKKEN